MESTTEVQDGGSSQASVLEEETKYKTPLTREEKIALQGNKFAKQMEREDNFTQERLLELQQGEQPAVEAPAPIPGVTHYYYTRYNKRPKYAPCRRSRARGVYRIYK